MKKLTKIVSLLLAVVMAACALASCGSTDWAYIEEKGSLTMGITLFEPMNYYDDAGNLTGFETEFAQEVCNRLGVTAEFQVIDWEQKEAELKARTIDLIWNGMTITEERAEHMAFSTPYVRNEQVIVIKKANAEKYATLEGMAGASVIAENGSAGQTAYETNDVLKENAFTPAAAQKDALLEVLAGTSEIAIVDVVMAQASIKEGTDYEDLMIVEGIALTNEEYAVGVRLEDTELLAKLNAAIDSMVQDGTLKALADKYGLADVYAFNET